MRLTLFVPRPVGNCTGAFKIKTQTNKSTFNTPKSAFSTPESIRTAFRISSPLKPLEQVRLHSRRPRGVASQRTAPQHSSRRRCAPTNISPHLGNRRRQGPQHHLPTCPRFLVQWYSDQHASFWVSGSRLIRVPRFFNIPPNQNPKITKWAKRPKKTAFPAWLFMLLHQAQVGLHGAD